MTNAIWSLGVTKWVCRMKHISEMNEKKWNHIVRGISHKNSICMLCWYEWMLRNNNILKVLVIGILTIETVEFKQSEE